MREHDPVAAEPLPATSLIVHTSVEFALIVTVPSGFEPEYGGAISGADYAIAFVDEIEKPEHRRQRFSVAY